MSKSETRGTMFTKEMADQNKAMLERATELIGDGAIEILQLTKTLETEFAVSELRAKRSAAKALRKWRYRLKLAASQDGT